MAGYSSSVWHPKIAPKDDFFGMSPSGRPRTACFQGSCSKRATLPSWDGRRFSAPLDPTGDLASPSSAALARPKCRNGRRQRPLFKVNLSVPSSKDSEDLEKL